MKKEVGREGKIGGKEEGKRKRHLYIKDRFGLYKNIPIDNITGKRPVLI